MLDGKFFLITQKNIKWLLRITLDNIKKMKMLDSYNLLAIKDGMVNQQVEGLS